MWISLMLSVLRTCKYNVHNTERVNGLIAFIVAEDNGT